MCLRGACFGDDDGVVAVDGVDGGVGVDATGEVEREEGEEEWRSDAGDTERLVSMW